MAIVRHPCCIEKQKQKQPTTNSFCLYYAANPKMTSEPSHTALSVGSVVRAKRPGRQKVSSKAMIATVNAATSSVCLIWEPLTPGPFSASEHFLITPSIEVANHDLEEEITISTDQVQPLFPFELFELSTVESDLKTGSIASFKEKGDILLRNGDASASIPYYELGLSKSSKLSIGCSIIVSIQGFSKVAEVDYIEDDGSLDVTIVESDEEITLRKTKVLLVIMEQDEERLQERILLNLSRCMLQLADLDSKYRSKYLKAAVLACSIVITVTCFHNPESASNSTYQTALYLKAKAHSLLSNWSNAIADANRLINAGKPEQGKKLVDTFHRQKRRQAKTNKKLARAVCELVQNATATSGDLLVSDLEGKKESAQSKLSASKPNFEEGTQQSFFFLYITLVLLAAILIQWSTSNDKSYARTLNC
jgi:hypothetical protein